ncbi:MAG: hypothetical protein Q9226_009097 [Calogaya cf. arnoldii]
MPPTAKQAPRSRRTREKQDPEIGKRLKTAAYVKSIKDHERQLYELETRTDELQDAETGYNTKLRQLEGLRVQKQQLIAEINARKAENQKMSALNGNLTVDLLRHQPASQLADSQIVERYEKLHANLSSWVDTQIQRFFDQAKEENDGRYADGGIFRHGGVPEYVAFLEAYPEYGGEYLVVSEVHLQLYDHLFKDDNMVFALLGDEACFMGAIEDGLTRLDPPRGRVVLFSRLAE